MVHSKSSHFVFVADISEDDAEPDNGNVTEMNYFYIRQFQVHLYRIRLDYSLLILKIKIQTLTFFPSHLSSDTKI